MYFLTFTSLLAEEESKKNVHVVALLKQLSRIWCHIYLSIISLPTESSAQVVQKISTSSLYHIIKPPITECIMIIFYALILGQALQHKFKEKRIFLEKGLSIFERIDLIKNYT